MRYIGINKIIFVAQVFLIGLVAIDFASWYFGTKTLIQVGNHLSSMSLSTSISFILGALALRLSKELQNAKIYRYLFLLCGLLIGTLAIASLLEITSNSPLNIDGVFELFGFRIVLFSPPEIAVQLLLSALAICVVVTPWKGRFFLAQGFAVAMGLFILVILVGYITDSINVFQLTADAGKSIASSIVLLFFSMALFFCFPDVALSKYLLTQSTGSAAQRYLIPFAIIAPVVTLIITRGMGNSGLLSHPDQDVATIIMLIVVFSLGTIYLRKLIDNSETQFELLANAAPVMIWMADANGRTTYFNAQWLSFTGRNIEDEVEVGFEKCVHPEDLPNANGVYTKAFKNQIPCTLEYRLLHQDGEYRWVLENATPYWGIGGEFKGFIGSCTDITGQKQASEKMQLAAHVFENSDQGIMITNADKRIIMTNPAYSELTGYTPEEVRRKTANFLSLEFHDEEFIRNMQAMLKKIGSWKGEAWNRRKDGGPFLEDLTINVVRDQTGKPAYYIGIFTDITQRKLNEEHYRNLAHFDPLTKLPNRTLLTDRIEQAISRAKRYKHKLAVMFIDLDKFKAINDEMGHHVGDLLLQQVAKRLTGSIRLEDTVARLGGDEFVVLLPSINSRDAAAVVAKKIILALAEPYQIEQYRIDNYPSIGISIFPEDAKEMKVLLNNADKAMYKAKQSAKTAYVFYALINQKTEESC
jgi:diguanylate cyclase (GGDEF)-like protein/PAS domain S-box-containing protein